MTHQELLSKKCSLSSVIDNSPGDDPNEGYHNHINLETFIEAIEIARSWSALACMSIGGASNCPDSQTIVDYKNQFAAEETRPVDIKEDAYLTEIISLLDIAFS